MSWPKGVPLRRVMRQRIAKAKRGLVTPTPTKTAMACTAEACADKLHKTAPAPKEAA